MSAKNSGGATTNIAARTRSAFRPIKRLGRRLARAGRGDARDSMAVIGYPTVTSVVAGEALELHLSARRSGAKSLIVERIGRLPVESQFTERLGALSPPAERGWEGYGWPITSSFTIPADWPSGLYGIRHGRDALFSFVVRSPGPGSAARVLVHVPFLTSAAYDPAGGKSLYGFNSQPDGSESARTSVVSLHRPSAWDPLGYSQTVRLSSLAEWLDDEGIAADYCSSVDLHSRPELLEHYDALVLPGHDEYWTRAMRDRVERFVSDGGNLIVLSGNTMYRQVRLDADDRIVTFYKYAGDDPWPRADEVTVAFADPPLRRPQNSLLGAGFTHGAIDGDASAYQVRFPAHWVFDGLDSPRTTSAFMTYETDAAGYVDEPAGYPRVSGDDGTPVTCTVLASAELAAWAKPGRATMTLFSRGGTVFNAGTTEWLDALQSDAVVDQVTRNVFARLGRRRAADWEHIGRAPDARALASADGSLFAVLHDGAFVRRHPVGADVPWIPVGAEIDAMSLAGVGATLYGVTADARVISCDVRTDDTWSAAGESLAGAGAVAALGGLLYAIDAQGCVFSTLPPSPSSAASWRRSPIAPLSAPVRALTALHGILIACTEDGRVLRSSADHINEDSVWIEIARCEGATGLAMVEWMLFATAADGRLLRLDLAGLRSPGVSV